MPQMQAMSAIIMFIEQKVVPLHTSYHFEDNVSHRLNKDFRPLPDTHAAGSQTPRALENVFQAHTPRDIPAGDKLHPHCTCNLALHWRSALHPDEDKCRESLDAQIRDRICHTRGAAA